MMADQLLAEELDELKLILNPAEPLGPSDSRNLTNLPLASGRLFQRQNDIYEELLKRSGIIVGRRGAGKTAFMNQLAASARYRYVVTCNAPDVFPRILGSIRSLFGVYPPFVEVTGHLWNILIWCTIFGKILELNEYSDARLQVVRDFVNAMPFEPTDTPEEIIPKVIQKLKERITVDDVPSTGPRTLNDALRFSGASFTAALSASQKFLKNGKKVSDPSPVLLLMDTLEEYRPEITESTDAISGLLHFLGHQAENRGFVDVRFCLPAELYSEWVDLSSNPMKDFSSQTLLHWHAGDLLRVIAHRASLYLRTNSVKQYDDAMSRFDINTRSGAGAFCRSLLPASVKGLTGVEEPSLAYILRHTQLLPRHVIDIFNHCLTLGVDRITGALGEVPADGIIKAVKQCEIRISSDVASAYRHKFPFFADICAQVIPNLPRRFTESELQKQFNYHGKGPNKPKFVDFKRMLFEAGAIGKETGKTTDIYIEAEFEYTVSGRLVVAFADTLCLHPLFSGRYPAPNGSNREAMPVFPRGSDPDVG